MKKILFISSLFAVIACTHGSDSSPQAVVPTNAAPTSLTQHALVQKPALTPMQQQEIVNLVGNAHELPDLESLFSNNSRDTQENNRDQRSVLSWIRNQCQIQTPVMNRTGDLNQMGTLSETKTQTIQGFGCPIYYSKNTRVDRSMTTTPTGRSSSMTETSEVNKTMMDAQLLIRTGVRTANSKITTTVVSSTEQGLRRVYKTSSSTSTVTTSRGANLVISGVSESLRQNRMEETYVEMNFQFPSSNPTLQIFTTAGQQRYFVNGLQYSERQVKDIFGGAL